MKEEILLWWLRHSFEEKFMLSHEFYPHVNVYSLTDNEIAFIYHIKTQIP